LYVLEGMAAIIESRNVPGENYGVEYLGE